MTFGQRAVMTTAVACALFAGASFSPASPARADTAVARTLSGAASWYGPGFHGRTTANGERYDMNGLTAAHRSIGFGTRVRVTNTANGRSVVVRINDRGPFVGRRVIDLSRGAAKAIGMIEAGVVRVKIEVLRSS